MIIYTFNILSLKKKTIGTIDDVVYGVTWEKVGLDPDGISGSYKVHSELSTSNIDSNNFISYSALTKQNVVDWIKSITNENELNSDIDKKIELKKQNNMQVDSGDFPWEV
jgi:hypothetical protein